MAFIPIYILILAFTIVVDYSAGLLLEATQGPARRLMLLMSLVANIGVLAFFKYYGFLFHNVEAILECFSLRWQLPMLNIILPIGLSFHTFQAMSYTIEVYQWAPEGRAAQSESSPCMSCSIRSWSPDQSNARRTFCISSASGTCSTTIG